MPPLLPALQPKGDAAVAFCKQTKWWKDESNDIYKISSFQSDYHQSNIYIFKWFDDKTQIYVYTHTSLNLCLQTQYTKYS